MKRMNGQRGHAPGLALKGVMTDIETEKGNKAAIVMMTMMMVMMTMMMVMMTMTAPRTKSPPCARMCHILSVSGQSNFVRYIITPFYRQDQSSEGPVTRPGRAGGCTAGSEGCGPDGPCRQTTTSCRPKNTTKMASGQPPSLWLSSTTLSLLGSKALKNTPDPGPGNGGMRLGCPHTPPGTSEKLSATRAPCACLTRWLPSAQGYSDPESDDEDPEEGMLCTC